MKLGEPLDSHCVWCAECDQRQSIVYCIVPCSLDEGETIMRTVSDFWVVCCKSGHRRFFVIINQKNANFADINGEQNFALVTIILLFLSLSVSISLSLSLSHAQRKLEDFVRKNLTISSS